MSVRDHFSSEPQGTPTAPGRYARVADLDAVEFVAGLEFRPLVGENMLASFVSFAPYTEAPMHTHVEEQIVIVLEGELEFNLDGDIRVMHPGDVAVVPPWVPHGAKTGASTCREVDIFNPPRESLLPRPAAQEVASGSDS